MVTVERDPLAEDRRKLPPPFFVPQDADDLARLQEDFPGACHRSQAPGMQADSPREIGAVLAGDITLRLQQHVDQAEWPGIPGHSSPGIEEKDQGGRSAREWFCCEPRPA